MSIHSQLTGLTQRSCIYYMPADRGKECSISGRAFFRQVKNPFGFRTIQTNGGRRHLSISNHMNCAKNKISAALIYKDKLVFKMGNEMLIFKVKLYVTMSLSIQDWHTYQCCTIPKCSQQDDYFLVMIIRKARDGKHIGSNPSPVDVHGSAVLHTVLQPLQGLVEQVLGALHTAARWRWLCCLMLQLPTSGKVQITPLCSKLAKSHA